MSIVDIVEALNKYINSLRAIHSLPIKGMQHLVSQFIIAPHSTFKAYKEYELTLWAVTRKDKYKVFSSYIKGNSANEGQLIKEVEQEFVLKLFDLIKDKHKLEDIIHGEYSCTEY